jgi:predicted kinase
MGTSASTSSSVLIAFSGLPGTGKTTLAEALGRRWRIPVFSVAWAIGVLQPLGVVNRTTRGTVAYAVLEMLGERQLALGQSAIIDGMLGSESVRARLREVAAAHHSNWAAVECWISNPDLHRRRIADRRESVPGWPAPDWAHVEEMRPLFEPWSSLRLAVDGARPLEDNLAAVTAWVHQAGWAG